MSGPCHYFNIDHYRRQCRIYNMSGPCHYLKIYHLQLLVDESRFCFPIIVKPNSERSNRCRYNTIKSQCTPTADRRRYAWQIFGSKSATFGSVDTATDTCNRRTTHARETTADPQLGLLSARQCCNSSSRASRSRKSRDCKQC